MLLKTECGIKYRESLVECLSQIPLLEPEDINLEIPTFEHDRFKSPTTEGGEHEDASSFDVSLDSWLQSLFEEGMSDTTTSKVICSIQPALMLSPHIIRAPLRSLRSDKRAELNT
jgi:hypothetical protein